MIPWYWELWEGLGAGPLLIEGDAFSYVPEPNYTDFQQKITMKSFRNDFLNFWVKVSNRIWVLG